MEEDKKEKKEYFPGLQQGNYLDGQIKGMMRNIGQGQKGIGENGREDRQEAKKQWR